MSKMTREERVEKVAELYNAGKSYGEIAKAIGMAPGSVYNHVKSGLKAGLITEKRGRPGQLVDEPSESQALEVLKKSTTLRLDSLFDAVLGLSERIENIEARLDALAVMDQPAKPIGKTNPDSKPTDLQSLWNPFAEAFTEKMQEIESIREQMRDLGIVESDYFPSANSGNLAENGQKRGTGAA